MGSEHMVLKRKDPSNLQLVEIWTLVPVSCQRSKDLKIDLALRPLISDGMLYPDQHRISPGSSALFSLTCSHLACSAVGGNPQFVRKDVRTRPRLISMAM